MYKSYRRRKPDGKLAITSLNPVTRPRAGAWLCTCRGCAQYTSVGAKASDPLLPVPMTLHTLSYSLSPLNPGPLWGLAAMAAYLGAGTAGAATVLFPATLRYGHRPIAIWSGRRPGTVAGVYLVGGSLKTRLGMAIMGAAWIGRVLADAWSVLQVVYCGVGLAVAVACRCLPPRAC